MVGMEGLEPELGDSCTRTIDANVRKKRLIRRFWGRHVLDCEFVIRVF